MTITSVTTAQFCQIIMNTVRHRRKVRRERYLMSLTQLADVSGWNADYVSGWETGRRQPTLRQALDCLEAAGC